MGEIPSLHARTDMMEVLTLGPTSLGSYMKCVNHELAVITYIHQLLEI